MIKNSNKQLTVFRIENLRCVSKNTGLNRLYFNQPIIQGGVKYK